jgi:hypothetical protein
MNTIQAANCHVMEYVQTERQVLMWIFITLFDGSVYLRIVGFRGRKSS